MRTIEEQYQKKTPIEHILLRPDTYIGSVELDTQTLFVYEENKIKTKTIDFVPGLYKIFDEILVNAADNKIRDRKMSYIKVNINTKSHYITVENDGRGIPIVKHKKENVYVPELIFGQLLTSSNYDDNEKKVTGGRNGYGAKLCNIFSETFVVETRSKNKFYRQVFFRNMSEREEPEIFNLSNEDLNEISEILKPRFGANETDRSDDIFNEINNTILNEINNRVDSREEEISTKLSISKKVVIARGEEKDFTRITFKPDLKRFGLTKLEENFVKLLHKRVYDMCATVPGIVVFLNDQRLSVRDFGSYCRLYFSNDDAPFCHAKINERWEVAVAPAEDGFTQVSFVNSISTTKGGTHVNHVVDQLVEPLADHIRRREKGLIVKPPQIKAALSVFVNCLVENPTFDSQTKETLTLHSRKFGSRCSPIEGLIKNIIKTPGIVERIVGLAKAKQSQQLKRTDGNRSSRLTGIPKLDDANLAGTKHGHRCTLILTEGDSAKTLAVSGLSVVGRDLYGVFPLRGKLLNVRDASTSQIVANAEITALKKILGLQHAKEYFDTTSLRYGHVMIMTDQDHDGSHIKGLLINFFDIFYPSLLKIPGFLQEFITPIVRASLPGKTSTIDFFTLPEFYTWCNETINSNRYKIKYYKGLGTSTAADAKYYFNNLPRHVKNFGELTIPDRELLALAFSKKYADRRKGWLSAIEPNTFLDNNPSTIHISDFVNKELILFSMADNIRSIPSVVDGLKPGQRKVIFSCFKRNLKNEIKVAQLAGYVAENSAYHHGEASLYGTIINLAQTFVGSNNINLLTPSGQFGTRLQGGKDAASPRYLFTNLEKITRLIFRPEDDDILTYLKDDNESIEPEYYVPVIPMVLINGPEGIGTGWSSTIPNYNCLDIISNLRKLINGEEMFEMVPYFKGFKGTIEGIQETRRSTDTVSTISITNTDNETQRETNTYSNFTSTNSILNYTNLNTPNNSSVDDPLIMTPLQTSGDNIFDSLQTPIANSYTPTYTKFIVTGIHEFLDNNDLEIKELPIGTWTQSYKEFLENLVTNNTIKDFKEYHTENTVYFKIISPTNITSNNIEKKLKLTTTISLNNLVCFDSQSKIKRFASALDIIQEFYQIRLRYYTLRKEYMLKVLFEDLKKLENKVRFIKEVVNNTLIISKRKKIDIENELVSKNYDKFDHSFDYLLNLSLVSLTLEKIDSLNNETLEKKLIYENLLKKPVKQLWLHDLDELEVAYKKDYDNLLKILKDEEDKRDLNTFGNRKKSTKRKLNDNNKKNESDRKNSNKKKNENKKNIIKKKSDKKPSEKKTRLAPVKKLQKKNHSDTETSQAESSSSSDDIVQRKTFKKGKNDIDNSD